MQFQRQRHSPTAPDHLESVPLHAALIFPQGRGGAF